ncbi:Uncharacterised protein [Dorea longicatena]|nr:Uncharacterised protein [Dorea longicatena]
MVVEYQKKHPDKPAHKLSQQDIGNLQIVAAYLSDHYAFDIPLERLTQIACMGTTKLKSCFKKYYDCTITECQYSTVACGCYQDSESSSEHKVSIALFRT